MSNTKAPPTDTVKGSRFEDTVVMAEGPQKKQVVLEQTLPMALKGKDLL